MTSPMEWLRHALGAAGWRMSARAAAAAWPRLACFDAPATVRKLVEAVPREAREQHASLALLEALALAQGNELEECRRRVELAGQLPTRPETRASSRHWSVRADVARAARRRPGGARPSLASAPRALGHGTRRRVEERRALRATALSSLGLVALLNRDVDAAEGALEEALEVAQLAQATFACIDSLGHLALLEAARGRLRRSAGSPTRRSTSPPTRLGRLASHRHRAARPGLGVVPLGGACAGGGHLGEAAAIARKSGDRLAKAVTALLSAFTCAHGQQAPRSPSPAARWRSPWPASPAPPRGVVRGGDAPLPAARGDLEEARAALDRAPRDQRTAAVVAARLALARGDPEGARARSKRGAERPRLKQRAWRRGC